MSSSNFEQPFTSTQKSTEGYIEAVTATKSCQFRDRCTRLDDEKHTKAFTHNPINCKIKDCPNINDPHHTRFYKHGATMFTGRRQRIQFTRENSDKIFITFTVIAEGANAYTNATGNYTTNIAKGQTESEIRDNIGHTLQMRYANPKIFKETSFEFNYVPVKDDEILPLPTNVEKVTEKETVGIDVCDILGDVSLVKTTPEDDILITDPV